MRWNAKHTKHDKAYFVALAKYEAKLDKYYNKLKARYLAKKVYPNKFKNMQLP